ncbi:unnamed protein product, partial [Prorocentrum cordatum]
QEPAAARVVTTFRGDIVQKYRVIRQLGAGVSGIAYLVQSKSTGQQYCAKEMPEHESLNEFNRLRELQHPNCLRVVELVQGQEVVAARWHAVAWLVTELAPGGDLFRYAKRLIEAGGAQALTEEWVAGVVKQALQGLAYMHSKKVVHNDIKPDNILIMNAFSANNPFGIPGVVIADFSLASLIDQHTEFNDGDPRCPGWEGAEAA